MVGKRVHFILKKSGDVCGPPNLPHCVIFSLDHKALADCLDTFFHLSRRALAFVFGRSKRCPGHKEQKQQDFKNADKKQGGSAGHLIFTIQIYFADESMIGSFFSVLLVFFEVSSIFDKRLRSFFSVHCINDDTGQSGTVSSVIKKAEIIEPA